MNIETMEINPAYNKYKSLEDNYPSVTELIVNVMSHWYKEQIKKIIYYFNALT